MLVDPLVLPQDCELWGVFGCLGSSLDVVLVADFVCAFLLDFDLSRGLIHPGTQAPHIFRYIYHI